jgi:hypothetical protein
MCADAMAKPLGEGLIFEVFNSGRHLMFWESTNAWFPSFLKIEEGEWLFGTQISGCVDCFFCFLWQA